MKQTDDSLYRRWKSIFSLPMLSINWWVSVGLSSNEKVRLFEVWSWRQQKIPGKTGFIVVELCWKRWNTFVWETSYQKPTHPQDIGLTSFVKKSIDKPPRNESIRYLRLWRYSFNYPVKHQSCTKLKKEKGVRENWLKMKKKFSCIFSHILVSVQLLVGFLTNKYRRTWNICKSYAYHIFAKLLSVNLHIV